MGDDLLGANKKTPRFTLKGIVTDAKCVDIYDGDTAQFVFRAPFFHKVYRFTCRMAGYNCAEIKAESDDEKAAARRARDKLRELILGKIVTLSVGDFDKYGRPLVHVICDNIDINQYMIDEKYGKAYDGRGEKVW